MENQSADGKRGTGFVFENYRGNELLAAIQKAVETFGQPKIWKELVQRAMQEDFSWDASARKYLELYDKILKK